MLELGWFGRALSFRETPISRLREGASHSSLQIVLPNSRAMVNDGFQLAEKEVDQLRLALFGEPSVAHQQRRQSVRFPFAAVQLALPLIPGRPLDRDSLCKVRCHDLSRSGISFYWPREPDFSNICLGLGTRGKRSWIKARVIHTRCIEGEEPRYLVGCALVERVDLPSLLAGSVEKATD